jgi:hypothetical protein
MTYLLIIAGLVIVGMMAVPILLGHAKWKAQQRKDWEPKEGDERNWL